MWTVKKSWFLSSEVWLCVGKVLGTPQCLFKENPLFWWNLNFQILAVKNMILTLAFGALQAWGFEVWLLNGCGLNLCFPKSFKQILDFHGENLVTCHLTFVAEIRHRFTTDDMDCDNHTGRGEQVYIYIHHAQC